jgi:hypothetical protein
MFPAIGYRDPLRDRVKSGIATPSTTVGEARAVFIRSICALCAGATVLIGCPLYSDDCDGANDCASGFYCEQFSQRCQPILDEVGCSRPQQCGSGETCTPDFVCRPGSCDYHGCVTGYRCGVVDSAHACVPVGGDAGPADAATEGAGDAAPAGDSGPDSAGLDASTSDASLTDDAGATP